MHSCRPAAQNISACLLTCCHDDQTHHHVVHRVWLFPVCSFNLRLFHEPVIYLPRKRFLEGVLRKAQVRKLLQIVLL